MKFKTTFQATGTTWIIEGDRGNTGDTSGVEQFDTDAFFDADTFTNVIKERIEQFESVYSRFRSDSLVAEIAHSDTRDTQGSDVQKKQYTFPDDAQELFALYRKMYDATDGLVTPLIGQVISDAGYDANYSLNPKPVIAHAKKWDDVMSYEHPILTVSEPVMLDFGAIGKGYAIDMIGRLMKENGFENFVVNAGGDILCRSTQVDNKITLRIGLEHPNNPKQVIGVAEISNQSICGSSGNRRAWGEYHHIINPDTATSPKHISALWVVTNAGLNHKNSTALADGFTTGLFFNEPQVLAEKTGFEFEYLIVYADNTINKSKNFPAELF